MPISQLAKLVVWFFRCGSHLRLILRSEGQVSDLGKRACLLSVSCGKGRRKLPDMISIVVLVCRLLHACVVKKEQMLQ